MYQKIKLNVQFSKLVSVLFFCTIIIISQLAFSQVIYSDLTDIYDYQRLKEKINRHNKYFGDINVVLKISKVFPISTSSKQLDNKQSSGLISFFMTDRFRYYGFSFQKGMELIRCGSEYCTTDDYIIQDVDDANVNEKYLKWYKNFVLLMSNNGKQMYEHITGTSGYDNSIPVGLVFSKNGVFGIASFQYSGWDRKGTGQILISIEFDKETRDIKSIHSIYDTGDKFGRAIEGIGNMFIE